jgi:hypothetical protein
MVRLNDKKAGELKRVLYSYCLFCSGVLLLDVFDIGKKGSLALIYTLNFVVFL